MEKFFKHSIWNLFTDNIIDFLSKDPIGRSSSLLRIATLMDKRKKHTGLIDIARRNINNTESRWSKFYVSFFTDLDRNVCKKFANNLVLKSLLTNSLKIENREKLGIPIPWAVLMDPTSACNLQCSGCWAADYGQVTSLDLDTLDRIINESRALGTYCFIFSGGEPLIRKKDIIKLCDKYQDCYFFCFTNGTLIDEELAKEIRRVGNFAPTISIEGFENETDFRRGKGTYQKVIDAMDLLKEHGILFGCSTCYHSKNTEILASDEFIEFLIEKGCRYAWYFTYMPVGSGAVTELLATPEQRRYMFERIREMRGEKPLFIMDFWNDGEFTGGCIAAGRRFLHINSNGDVEPCAFIHYSGVNIRNATMLEALSQPLFMEYQKRQPFNHNMLQSCPCLDNPAQLKEMVNIAQAHSTQLKEVESVEQLTAKCENAAISWGPVAHLLWTERSENLNLKEKVV